jgi:ubiquinone/menaquinone biosynthesis C-methylase UbiE
VSHNGDTAWSGWTARLYAWFHRHPAAGRAVVERAGLEAQMRVLDIGCGTGAAIIEAASHLTAGAAVGVDPSPEFIRIAHRRARGLANVTFELGAAEHLPLAAHQFDVTWSIHSAHHWADRAAGVAEAFRVICPAGRFLVVERQASDRPWGISAAEAQQLADTMAQAGFVDVEIDKLAVGRRNELVISGRVPGR